MKRFYLLAVIALVGALLLFPAVGGANSQSEATQPPEMVKVLIAFDRQPGPDEQAIVHSHGGSIKYTYHLVPAIAASVPKAAIDGLLRNPRVVRIEPDAEVHAIDAELDNSWGVKRIGAGAVHATNNTGAGVKVAVIDSGIDYNHPDLNANYEGGYDFVNRDIDPMDDNGHGTHVAGIIAAKDDGAGVVGVAPGARIYALKVLGANGSGSYSDIIAALQWSVDNGIQVTNNSYGSAKDPGATVKEAFDNAYLAGVLSVAAAGNSGNPRGKGDNVIYPARYASVIAVAATDSSDNRAGFSSTGPDVELAAPGVAINSTLPGGLYGSLSGTSMASPHVAGTAALVIASGVSGPANVRAKLQSTADDLGPAGWDPYYGYGLVDAAKAASSSPGTPQVFISAPANGSTFYTGQSIAFSGTASDLEDGNLTSSLIWTSSIDGVIGTGGSFSTTLSEGSHTVTASATDANGNVGSASINVTVVAPPGAANTVSVSKIDYSTTGGKNRNQHLQVAVYLIDDLGNPVANASVSIDLSLNGSPYLSATGTTGTDGKAVFKANNAPSGTYVTTVTAVNATGLTWDGVTPTNEFVK